jgi:hypothetical protein
MRASQRSAAALAAALCVSDSLTTARAQAVDAQFRRTEVVVPAFAAMPTPLLAGPNEIENPLAEALGQLCFAQMDNESVMLCSNKDLHLITESRVCFRLVCLRYSRGCTSPV